MISVSIKLVNTLTSMLKTAWTNVYAIFSTANSIVFSDGSKKIFRTRL